MQTKKTKPLRVTDDQQKVWDLFTAHWKKITSLLGFIISIAFYTGSYTKGLSENNNFNNLTLKHANELAEVRKAESDNCNEIMKNYKELVDKLIPIKDNKDEK